jgi:hypothetical protein
MKLLYCIILRGWYRRAKVLATVLPNDATNVLSP